MSVAGYVSLDISESIGSMFELVQLSNGSIS
jgi:hypothetical protein